jgi:hypothetical protein
MANIGLDRANPERVSRCPTLPKDVVDGGGLDGITNSSTRAVGLDEPAVGRVQSRITVYLAHECLCFTGQCFVQVVIGFEIIS